MRRPHRRRLSGGQRTQGADRRHAGGAGALMPAAMVPATVADITPGWLETALSPRFPGVRIAAMAMDGFIDGTAQKCRFAVDYNPAGAAGPPSLWVKGGFDPKGASQGNA